jgi:isopenicillin N synthase-like dioxygenase
MRGITSNSGYVGVERERLAPSQPGDLKEALNLTAKFLIQSPGFREGFRSCVLSFWEACIQLTNTVLQAFALALQLPIRFG